MPYKSEAQRRYLHAKHPKIAARWDRELKGKPARAKRTNQERRAKK